MPKKPINPDNLTWWHSITLPDGTKTKGQHDYDTATGDRYLFPEVTGKKVLDIGTFDGYWSARAVKGGAAEVMAIDINERKTAHYIAEQFGFTYTPSNRADMNRPCFFHQWDVVLFYGVVYHLYNPVQGIVNAFISTLPGGICLIESAVNQAGAHGGQVRFNPYPHDGDDTNHFMPTIEGLKETILLAAKIAEREIELQQEATDEGKFRWTGKYLVK
jgi:tRNA (mo5U34)-methyltransferase